MLFTVTLLSMAAALAGAQVTYNRTLNAYVCTSSGGTYCVDASLSSNIIIRCTEGIGRPGNCDDNLAGIPPQGVKEFAPCYEPTPNSGQAACSYVDIVYPEDGRSPFPIALPGSFNQDIKTINASVITTTRFANSSRTSSASAETTVGFANGPYVSNIFNVTDSTPARITASFSSMPFKQIAANLENKDTYPSLTSVMDTVPSTGMVSAISTPTGTTSTGGVGKLVAQAWGMWVAAMAFGVMAV